MAAQTSPKGKATEKGVQSGNPPKPKDYTSHGIKDNDIFLLPSRDYQIMGALTALALVVRLYKIYQPTSVVFDEVQYVFPPRGCSVEDAVADKSIASAASLPSTSRGASSWMSTLHWQNC